MNAVTRGRADAATVPNWPRIPRRRLLKLAGGLALLGCDPDLAADRGDPSPFMHGVTLPAFTRTDFDEARVQRILTSAVAAGIDWVAVAPGWFQRTRWDVSMRPDPARTPSDEAVARVIRAARASGLRVLVKPYVDSADGVWRGDFRPADLKAWMRAYREMHLRYTQVAAEAGADMLCLGVELNFVDGRLPDRWQRLIEDTRAVYAGPLTYAANHSPAATGGGYATVAFWPELDFIGIDAYFPLEASGRYRATRLAQAWVRHLDAIGLWRLRAGLEQPVLFTELGYESAAGAALTPWGVDRSRLVRVDTAEQAELYAAFYDRPYARDMLQGVFWWWWDPDLAGRDPSGFAPNGKPAADVLRSAHAQAGRRPGMPFELRRRRQPSAAARDSTSVDRGGSIRRDRAARPVPRPSF